MATIAGAKTDLLENDLLKWLTGTTPTILSGTANTPWIGLYTGTVGDEDGTTGWTEVSGGSYARVNASGLWGAITGGTLTNNATISFPTASASWGTVTAWAIHTASTAGTRLYGGALVASKLVNSGDTAQFVSGAFIINES